MGKLKFKYQSIEFSRKVDVNEFLDNFCLTPTQNKKKRDQKGQTKEMSHDSIIELVGSIKEFLQKKGATMMTASELAELLQISNNSANYYLNRISEYGYMYKRRREGVVVFYSLCDRVSPTGLINELTVLAK